MKTLFGDEISRKIPKKVLIDVLLKGRKLTGKGEDDWETVDICNVMGLLPEEYKSTVLGQDPVRFKNRMQRLRKDKDVPKVKPTSEMMGRLQKMARDFRRNKQRSPAIHSKDYLDYLQSDAWREKSREHKERCNWRCQFCGKFNSDLECHHTSEGYKALKKEMPWHILAVCGDTCHPILDMMREFGFENTDALSIFSEDEIPQ